MATITPDDVRWLAPAASPRLQRRCPVCGATTPASPILAVPGLAPPHPTLTLLRCGGCASAFYDPPGIRDFSDLGQQHEGFWRFYVEAGAGVWETLWPLLAGCDRGSLLEVGCGFGFTLDFWQRTGRGEAVGVELAEYGREGARQLGVTIHAERLEACAALAGRAFDVVYASEVIEHVEDPAAFVALLARFVRDDGLLVLTTPAAAFVEPAQHGSTLLAVLAPGFHGFLLSGEAFAAAARRAGFAHVEVRRFHERQVLWASRRPRAPRGDPERLRGAYFDYMALRLALPGESEPLWQGLAYRDLRDLVNTGRLAEARPVAARLARGVAERHGAAILDPGVTVPRLEACRTLTDVGRIGPFFLPGLYHFLGALAQHAEHDTVAARRYYRGAAAAALACARVGVVYFLEAVATLWPARIADALLALAAGDAAGADALAEAADEGLAAAPRHAFATMAPEQIEALLPPVIDGLRGRGDARSARVLADAYLRHVRRRYGEPWASAEQVRTAIGAGATRHPADPLYAAYLETLAALADHGREAARASAAGFVAAAEAVGPPHAARARDLAARVRAAAGLPAPAPAFSFEMTFRLPPSR